MQRPTRLDLSIAIGRRGQATPLNGLALGHLPRRARNLHVSPIIPPAAQEVAESLFLSSDPVLLSCRAPGCSS
ncbi:hypothetical protein L798_00362 [Zootermopsis nevadensis]|uniref:Uncharacterized protein n=1 Tax=Zootermopsis nevadensis TaxID=136037 RepID=A0A067QXX4_ZOONE|nr:hypothetical protein L798_00362 [Zootermopsis nevadensis]